MMKTGVSKVGVSLAALMAEAGELRDRGHGRLISYSRKVFIPLTHLCRDVCHYCTFAERPRAGQPAYLSPEQVLAIARAGAAAGCTEALFTLGDKPELRYQRGARGAGGAGPRDDDRLPDGDVRAWCCARPDCCRMPIPAS